MNLLLIGSRPVVGSSRKSTLGLPTVESKIDSLLFIPPENVLTSLSA
jgi:hypothetical protein